MHIINYSFIVGHNHFQYKIDFNTRIYSTQLEIKNSIIPSNEQLITRIEDIDNRLFIRNK